MKYSLFFLTGNNIFNQWCIAPKAKNIQDLIGWLDHSGTGLVFNQSYQLKSLAKMNYLGRISSLDNGGITKNFIYNVNLDFGDLVHMETDIPIIPAINPVATASAYSKNAATNYGYVIVLESDAEPTLLSNIHSRWYIENLSYTGQDNAHLWLRRDVAADFYDKLINMPVMIERGPLDVNDDLIFQPEGNTYNQIKKAEHLLKQTDNDWYVLYFDNHNRTVPGGESNPKVVSANNILKDEVISVPSLSTWPVFNKYFKPSDIENEGLHDTITGEAWSTPTLRAVMTGQPYSLASAAFKFGFWDGQETSYEYVDSEMNWTTGLGLSTDVANFGSTQVGSNYYNWCARRNNSTANAVMNNYLRNEVSTDEFERLIRQYFRDYTNFCNDITDVQALDGKVVWSVGSQRYYRISVTTNGSATGHDLLNTITTQRSQGNYAHYPVANTDLLGALSDIIPQLTTELNDWCLHNQVNALWWNGGSDTPYSDWTGSPADDRAQTQLNRDSIMAINSTTSSSIPWNLIKQGFEFSPLGYDYTITLTKINLYDPNIEIRTGVDYQEYTPHPIDAPYDIAFIPASGSYKYNGTSYTVDEDYMFAIANAIATEMGGSSNGHLYDIQRLPYYWNINAIINNEINITSDDYVREIKKIDGGNETTIGHIIWAKKSSFRGVITNTATYNINGLTGNELKVKSETEFYRVVSPNYNGQFEFTPAKNGGIDYWEYNCTYKPYQPYIHINPNFGRLYGGDFNDQRGLICSGDFSMPIVNDAWVNFMLQNKNYENTFNREVESLEFQAKQAQSREIVSGITGALGAAAGGAFAGFTVSGGNPVGAVIGGIAGGISSLVGGTVNTVMNERERQESIAARKDIHNLNTESIKAQASSLGRTNAFDINSKRWPFVEVYDATDREKNALRSYIKYYSMKVGVEGTITEYLESSPRFFTASLISTLDLSTFDRLPDPNDTENTDVGPVIIKEFLQILKQGIYLKQEVNS